MTRIRESVSLRSLEQRSPLNIYVDEADKFFNEMKKNIAHAIIVSIHNLYIPKINQELFNSLSSVVSAALTDNPTKVNEVDNLLNATPNLKINVEPVSPKDKPHVHDKNKADAKETLMEKMKQAQQEKK
jgi:preprotein translocase subunit SecA